MEVGVWQLASLFKYFWSIFRLSDSTFESLILKSFQSVWKDRFLKFYPNTTIFLKEAFLGVYKHLKTCKHTLKTCYCTLLVLELKNMIIFSLFIVYLLSRNEICLKPTGWRERQIVGDSSRSVFTSNHCFSSIRIQVLFSVLGGRVQWAKWWSNKTQVLSLH